MTLLNPNSTKLALSIALLLHAAMAWWLWHEPVHKVELAASVESYLSMTMVMEEVSPEATAVSQVMNEVHQSQHSDEPTPVMTERDATSRLTEAKVNSIHAKPKVVKATVNHVNREVVQPTNMTEQTPNRDAQAILSVLSAQAMDVAQVVAVNAPTMVQSTWQESYDSQVVAALKRCTRYPEAAREEAIFGRVLVSFVMQPNGKAVKAQLLSPAHELLESAALEAIECLPLLPFPAEADADKRSYQLPIAFYIE